MDLAVAIYKATKAFPRDEAYGLTSQLRRASVAIPSNITEGQSRGHKSEYVQFLRIAFSSVTEIETQLEISHRVGYLDNDTYVKLYNEITIIEKMLSRLINKLLEPST